MLGEAMNDSAMPTALYLYVDDADRVYKSALDAGGESVRAPEDMFWGDRVATVKDSAGNIWWIATHVEEPGAEEIERRARQAMAS
jgi:uncharacterized glyoxalase superfamily protein PhnB